MNDLISRQDAIDAIREMSPELFSAYQHNVYIDRQGALVRLMALPSAKQWIPCSERLPEEGEKVLASTKNTIFTQVFKGIQGASDSWWWNNNTIKTIYAWMPLLEPWKGADGEK